MKIKQYAVDNFLGSLDLNIPRGEQHQNVFLDARLYKWNKETIKAILDGIDAAYQRKAQEVKQ